MLTKRIIPCLDIHDGRVVKGVQFENIQVAGDPVSMASRYVSAGADELMFLDISATLEGRKIFVSLVRELSRMINIPFTVGGGIRSAADVKTLLEAGADKVSVNSAALGNPELIDELATAFGSQCIVLAIDAKTEGMRWRVYSRGGTKATDRELFSWAKEGESRGCGEILFTSIDHDGTKSGFALEPLTELHARQRIPVIASGGGGNATHFLDAFVQAKADAVLAASVFHFGELQLPELKKYLSMNHVPVRL